MSSEATDVQADFDQVADFVRLYVPAGFGDDNGVWHDGPHRASALAALNRLLAEVARLEQALQDARYDYQDNLAASFRERDSIAADLAAARAREQYALDVLASLLDAAQLHNAADLDDDAPAVVAARAALADQPAADEGAAVVWSEPRQDYTGRVYRDGLATGTPSAAVEPRVSDECPKHGFYKAGYVCPYCASAAADEPGERE